MKGFSCFLINKAVIILMKPYEEISVAPSGTGTSAVRRREGLKRKDPDLPSINSFQPAAIPMQTFLSGDGGAVDLGPNLISSVRDGFVNASFAFIRAEPGRGARASHLNTKGPGTSA